MQINNSDSCANKLEKSGSNPWERVIDNCEMDPNRYAGDKDVSRMRQVMVSRKADINQKGGL